MWMNAMPLASWGPQDGGSMWHLRPWVGLLRVDGKPGGQPLAHPLIAGCSVASSGSGSFPCRGTDELLSVVDQVTIINSTLGKALGGASGAYRVVLLGSTYPQAGPWRSLGEGGDGRPGTAEKGSMDYQEELRVDSGSWPLTVPTSALVLRGLHNGAWAPGVPAAAACPALPLL